MTNEGLKILLDTIHKEIENNRDTVKETMSAGFTSVRAKIEAEVDGVNRRIDDIIKHQERQNGALKCLEDDLEGVEKETVIVRWFQRNPGKAFVVMFAFVFAVAFAFHAVDLKETLKSKGIELKDK